MRIALTGATGLAGWPILRHLRAAGHEVVTLGRRDSDILWHLGDRPDLGGIDALVHAAFAHVPGRYRGGEGDDPAGFLRLNRDGSLRLLEAGPRMVFLSTRAVYGAYPPGTRLTENLPPRPDTLYGEMKREVEIAVTAAGGTSLRATGLYGPPPPTRDHKWRDLFAAFEAGAAIPPRVATEVHGDDLATAVRIALAAGTPPVLNVSDLMLDRRDLLAAWSDASGIRGPLPARADPGAVSEMDTSRIRALGWTPRGTEGLRATLRHFAHDWPV